MRSKVSSWWRNRSFASSQRAIKHTNDFNEKWYLGQNLDVAEAVRDGAFHSGHEHFVRWGYFEGRAGSPDGKAGVTAKPAIEHVLSVGRHYVVIGRCNSAEDIIAVKSSNGDQLEIVSLTTHRHAGGDLPAFGFVLVTEAEPASISFGIEWECNCVLPPAKSTFTQICKLARTERLLDLILVSQSLDISSEQEAALSESVSSRLLKTEKPYIDTPFFAMALDDAWIGSASRAAFFSGWFLQAPGNDRIGWRAFSCSRTKITPVNTLTELIERPDLDSFRQKFAIASKPGFIGYCASDSVDAPLKILVIIKDQASRLFVLSKHLNTIDDLKLCKGILNILGNSLRLTVDRRKLLTLFQEMFPVTKLDLDIPARWPLAFEKPRTCYLFFDLAADTTELHLVIEEIVQHRFHQLVVLGISDFPGSDMSAALKDFSKRNPAIKVNGKIVAGDHPLFPLNDAQPDDVVIFGRPLDILQFEIDDNAIHRVLAASDEGCMKSYGYFHDELPPFQGGFADAFMSELDMNATGRMFQHTTGFAAFMPAFHFQAQFSSTVPMFFQSSTVKALVLALVNRGIAEIRFYNGTKFFSSASSRDRHGIDERTQAEIDFCRLIPITSKVERRQK